MPKQQRRLYGALLGLLFLVSVILTIQAFAAQPSGQIKTAPQARYLYLINDQGVCVLFSTIQSDPKVTTSGPTMVAWVDIFGTFHSHYVGHCELHVTSSRLPIRGCVINIDAGIGFQDPPQGKPPVTQIGPPDKE